MRTSNSLRWAVLVTVNVACWCMLSLQQPSAAAPGATKPPFANSVEQRFEIIDQLKQLNEQIREQNKLLRSGTLRVVVEPAEKP